MKVGSLRKDCLLAFLVRWVERVAGAGCGADCFEPGLIISSSRGPPPPPPPPPAARTDIVGAVAIIPAERTVSVANLIANLDMRFPPVTCARSFQPQVLTPLCLRHSRSRIRLPRM